MENKFYALKYKGDKNYEYIKLDQRVNEITGSKLIKLGMELDCKLAEDKFITIYKYENQIDKSIKWEIANNLKQEKEIYLYIKNKDGISEEVTIEVNKRKSLNIITDATLSFNKYNEDCLFFSLMNNESCLKNNESDEPIDLSLEELDKLINLDYDLDNSSFLRPSSKKFSSTATNNVENLKPEKERRYIPIKCETPVRQKRVEEKDSKSFSNSFNEKNDEQLYELLKKYDNFSSSKPSVNKDIINNNIKEVDDSCIKINKIITDEEEENKKSTVLRTINKNYVEDDFNFLNEEILDQLFKECEEDYLPNTKLKKENSPGNRLTKVSITKLKQQQEDKYWDSMKKRDNFNSNGKRASNNKELTEIINSNFKSRKLKKATENRELQIDFNAQCPICLDNILNLANLDNCRHDFCKPCILQWSKNTNLCPLCKKEFKKIFYYEKNKRKELKIKKKKLVVEEEYEEYEIETATECMICRTYNNLDRLLVCDGCNYNICHTYCDNLSTIPLDDWFCPACRNQRRMSHNAQVNEENEDSNDEDYLMELKDNVIYPEEVEYSGNFIQNFRSTRSSTNININNSRRSRSNSNSSRHSNNNSSRSIVTRSRSNR